MGCCSVCGSCVDAADWLSVTVCSACDASVMSLLCVRFYWLSDLRAVPPRVLCFNHIFHHIKRKELYKYKVLLFFIVKNYQTFCNLVLAFLNKVIIIVLVILGHFI